MENKNVKLMLGNNIDRLKELPDNFVDSIVTDPPYGLSFMNKKWDYDVPSVEFWKEVLRVLKPGGHVLSFGGTRTYHRMVVNMEDAGFEIRDQIMWVYGSGFPKSLNIGKEVDKKLGNEREVVEYKYQNRIPNGRSGIGVSGNHNTQIRKQEGDTKGNSDWEGWGTGLKPANEPICLARKPIEEKTITDNVLKYGTGGINIDGCRVELNGDNTSRKQTDTNVEIYGWSNHKGKIGSMDNKWMEGRFPANFIIDEEASKLLDEQSGDSKSQGGKGKATQKSLDRTDIGYGFKEIDNAAGLGGYGDTGGASRFFYVPKVSKKERNMGLDDFKEINNPSSNYGFTQNFTSTELEIKRLPVKNNHPTVKPINLLTYLCRLITPKGGVILDPYMGSGSTGISALLEGFEFIGMEMDEDYFKIAETRINNYELYKDLIKKK